MTKRYLTILFVSLLLPVLLFAQNESVKKKAPLFFDDEAALQNYSPSPIGSDIPQFVANYVAVDTMSNSFGPASNTINPVAYDQMAGVMAIVHRGNANTYAAGSGELWWNYSTDYGMTWTRSTTSVQNNQTSQILARYPSMTIQNATGSTNLADLWGAFSWPELATSFEYIGYGVTIGMEVSAFAEIDFDPPIYGSNVPTFADDMYIYWTSDNSDDASLDLFRTQDYSVVEKIEPPTWNSARFGDNGNIQMGGVTYNGVVYVGLTASYTEEIGAGGWEVGYSKSTDNGATWSDWFIVDWTTIPATANYSELWDWKKGDAFVSFSADINVDKDGLVHILTGLTDSVTTENAIVEFYETAEGVWDVKILASGSEVHDNSIYEGPLNAGGYNQDPAVGQNGPSFMLAANYDRDFFAATWDIGSPETADTLCDIYVKTRELAGEWDATAENLTGTDMMNEDGSHLAPLMATTDDGTTKTDWIISMFWYEAGNTGPYVDPLNPHVVYAAVHPVRQTTGVNNDITSNFSFELAQNYPNPFNPSTSISYTLPEKSFVTLKVYDVLGNEVATLVNEERNTGANNVSFDASKLASGVYVYTITAGQFTSTKKMMLMK